MESDRKLYFGDLCKRVIDLSPRRVPVGAGLEGIEFQEADLNVQRTAT